MDQRLTIDCGTPITISYQSLYEDFFFFDVYGLKSNCVLNLKYSYYCHSLQTLQQEGHVANNNKL